MMSQEWIVDVLADLQSFARQNGMSSLAEQLDDTMMVAAAELAQTAEGGSKLTDPHAHRVASIHRGLTSSEIS